MQPPSDGLPAPPPPGFTGIWRGGCCPGFRMRAPGGYPVGGYHYGSQQHGPQGHQQRPGLRGQQGAPEQQHMSLDLGPPLGPVRYRSPQEIAEATAWLERYSGGPALDLRPPGTVVMHKVAMAIAKAQAVPPVPQVSGGTLRQQQQREAPPERQHQQPEELPERSQGGETLLQRILRLAREGSVCIAPTPAATPDQTPEVTPRASSSSTSEPEVVDV